MICDRRPALILSGRQFNEHGYTLMAMITKAEESQWYSDTPFDGRSVGLSVPCIVRMKLFTLDNSLILRRIGRLHEEDWAAVQENFRKIL